MTRYAVALSGGPDSLCAAALMPPGQAFIVDHQLRPESGHEAAQAALSAEALGHQPHIIPLTWDQPPHTQAHYRRARYRALALACQRLNIDQLWTGHHADDQAETLLMRMEKGSGLLGLSGMPYAQPFARALLLRPLLTTARADIEAYLRARDRNWISDPSNSDLKYPRASFRTYLKSASSLSERLANLSLRLGGYRNSVLAEARDFEIDISLLGVVCLPVEPTRALSHAALEEVLRACVQWLGGQAYPALADHKALVRNPSAGRRSTGGGVVMASGRNFRLAPEGRETGGLSMESLGARAWQARQNQTTQGLWLPEGRATLPFVAERLQWARLYCSDKTPKPLEGGPWIETLRALPI